MTHGQFKDSLPKFYSSCLRRVRISDVLAVFYAARPHIASRFGKRRMRFATGALVMLLRILRGIVYRLFYHATYIRKIGHHSESRSSGIIATRMQHR
jgi:hypothetical protein